MKQGYLPVSDPLGTLKPSLLWPCRNVLCQRPVNINLSHPLPRCFVSRLNDWTNVNHKGLILSASPTSPQKKSRIWPLLPLTGVARSEGPMFLKISLITISPACSASDSPEVTLGGGVAVGAPDIGLTAPPGHVTPHWGCHVVTNISLKKLVTRDQNLIVR